MTTASVSRREITDKLRRSLNIQLRLARSMRDTLAENILTADENRRMKFLGGVQWRCPPWLRQCSGRGFNVPHLRYAEWMGLH